MHPWYFGALYIFLFRTSTFHPYCFILQCWAQSTLSLGVLFTIAPALLQLIFQSLQSGQEALVKGTLSRLPLHVIHALAI
jgi:hypothetical protein